MYYCLLENYAIRVYNEIRLAHLCEWFQEALVPVTDKRDKVRGDLYEENKTLDIGMLRRCCGDGVCGVCEFGRCQ